MEIIYPEKIYWCFCLLKSRVLVAIDKDKSVLVKRVLLNEGGKKQNKQTKSDSLYRGTL